MLSTTIYGIWESNRCVGREELYDIFYDYFCEDEPIPEFESDGYWQFNEIVNQSESEFFWNELECSKLKRDSFLITGRFGWYNHYRKVQPYVMVGIENAISSCLERADNCEVSFENGSIILNTQHHDGNDWFEVRRLSEEGRKRAQDAHIAGKAVQPSPDWFAPLTIEEIDF